MTCANIPREGWWWKGGGGTLWSVIKGRHGSGGLVVAPDRRHNLPYSGLGKHSQGALLVSISLALTRVNTAMPGDVRRLSPSVRRSRARGSFEHSALHQSWAVARLGTAAREILEQLQEGYRSSGVLTPFPSHLGAKGTLNSPTVSLGAIPRGVPRDLAADLTHHVEGSDWCTKTS